MYTLGIETSCDETAASVTRDKEILSNVVSSSVHLHSEYGGVVPEIASRWHVEYINGAIKESLRRAGITLKKISLIAVTEGPGLTGSLLTGVSMARALGYSLGVPVIEVDHLIAHIYANMMCRKDIPFPLVGLVVSGGHTSLIRMDAVDEWQTIGQTQDDAAGEAFDKVAKLLGLGYPGGPAIEKRASSGNPRKIRFPRSVMRENKLDFSFSGIKTAVLYYVKRLTAEKSPHTAYCLPPATVNDICAGFQSAVCDMIAKKAALAARRERIRTLSAGGGVVANKALCSDIASECAKWGIEAHFPPMELCLDNAAMVGGLGEALYRKRKDLKIYTDMI